MLVLIGAKKNHGPFGQKFNGSERTVALRPEPGAGVAGPSRSRGRWYRGSAVARCLPAGFAEAVHQQGRNDADEEDSGQYL